MENMQGFHPAWQLKRWVLGALYLLTLLLVARQGQLKQLHQANSLRHVQHHAPRR